MNVLLNELWLLMLRISELRSNDFRGGLSDDLLVVFFAFIFDNGAVITGVCRCYYFIIIRKSNIINTSQQFFTLTVSNF